MNIFAIDLGNKRIKMKSEYAEYSYPASYLTTNFLSSDSLAAHEQIVDNQIYTLDGDSGMGFVWGSALEIYNLPEKMIDTYARVRRMEQKKTQRILEFALGRLALDFDNAFSEAEPLIVHVMLGAPITDLHKDSDTAAILKKLLIGRHHLQINGKDIWIEIPSEENVSIIPQYMGTILNFSFDAELNPIETHVEGKLGVIDIGGGTILINSSNALNLSPTGTDKFLGIQSLIKEISSEINSTKPFLIEKLLREGSRSTGYFYKTNKNKKDVRDITGIVTQAIENYTRFTIAPLVTENFPDLEEFDFIIMTGGGSAIISQQALRDEIGETYFDQLIFIDEPELSNVRGFYKGASIKWGTGEEQTKPSLIAEDTASVISNQWGSSSVEFDCETGVLTVYQGELNATAWPDTISRSDVKEIHFVEEVNFPESCISLFGGDVYRSLENAMTSLTVIRGMENISTKDVIDMSFMFNGCMLLEQINLSSFNTSKVRAFSNMFTNCQSLTTLNFETFDTAQVENFDSMFLDCTKLNNLDLKNFNMNAARTSINMFVGCDSLENLTLPA